MLLSVWLILEAVIQRSFDDRQASCGPATGKQATTSYYKGTSVFVHTKGGLMFEAAIGGQKFSFKPVGN